MTVARNGKQKKLKFLFDVELSETFFIGKIVALWGALEWEIFAQTLLSFPYVEDAQSLPKAMNNIQFSEVLKLWKERVIEPEKLKGKKNVLAEQYDKIIHLSEFRTGIVHGMWDYDSRQPFRIKTVRVKKQELVTVEFPPDDLEEITMALREINFKIRHPRGLTDYAKTVGEQGSWLSRRFIASALGDPRADELLPESIRAALRAAEAKK